jgi:hypothetical protein
MMNKFISGLFLLGLLLLGVTGGSASSTVEGMYATLFSLSICLICSGRGKLLTEDCQPAHVTVLTLVAVRFSLVLLLLLVSCTILVCFHRPL